MPEADDDGVTEVAHAVGVGAQVVIVGTVRDPVDRGSGRIDLDERDGAMCLKRLRVRHVERVRSSRCR